MFRAQVNNIRKMGISADALFSPPDDVIRDALLQVPDMHASRAKELLRAHLRLYGYNRECWALWEFKGCPQPEATGGAWGSSDDDINSSTPYTSSNYNAYAPLSNEDEISWLHLVTNDAKRTVLKENTQYRLSKFLPELNKLGLDDLVPEFMSSEGAAVWTFIESEQREEVLEAQTTSNPNPSSKNDFSHLGLRLGLIPLSPKKLRGM